MIEVEAVAAWLGDRLPEYLDDLRALVEVDCGTADKAGVDRVGCLLRERLATLGCEITVYPLEKYGDCYLATFRGNGNGRILLSGHLDTVYPDGTVAARPMHIDGRRVLGPGVCDMKAGLLAGYYAMRALQASGRRDFGRVDFFLNSEEEIGSPASQHLYAAVARQAKAALVLECGRMNGDIVSARKGSGTYRFTVQGKQAHAGVEPWRGANAVLELAHCIQAAAALNGQAPGTTVSPGVVAGGTRPNVVPDLAWLDVDVRFVTAEAGHALDQALRDIAAQPVVPGTRTELSGGIEHPPMEKTHASAGLVETARAIAARLGFGFADVLTGGASDGNNIAALGVPTLDGMGPVGGLDHSPDEYLELDSILPRTALLAGLIAAISTRESL